MKTHKLSEEMDFVKRGSDLEKNEILLFWTFLKIFKLRIFGYSGFDLVTNINQF